MGLCFDLGIPMQVANVREDERHNAAFDEATGFDTRTMLCVPIKNPEFGAVGVIQLLNAPPGGFSQAHVDAVEMVAQALAGPLST